MIYVFLLALFIQFVLWTITFSWILREKDIFGVDWVVVLDVETALIFMGLRDYQVDNIWEYNIF